MRFPSLQGDILMSGGWVISSLLLWVFVLFLGFMLLGVLRALALMRWRLEQLEATTPSRVGRSGLKPGQKAPDFTLPSVSGGDVSLHDFAGRQLLLVFTQSGCGPCRRVAPDLNRLQDAGEVQVVLINNGDPEATRKWAAEVQARFPVLQQEKFSVSRRYQTYATPFAFLIDPQGVIASKGIINNAQHIGFVLSRARPGSKADESDSELSGTERGASEEFHSSSCVKEVSHV
jgi:methylamine dehydrogenase accessory protein MauD